MTDLKSCLDNLHCELGASMVSYAGYQMPLYYKAGAIAEHVHTRTNASLFDVSHMVQVRVSGKDSALALEKIMPGDFCALPLHRQVYSVMSNESGGVIDDVMVSRRGEHDYYLVLNAARKDQDLRHLGTRLPDTVQMSHLEEEALLALQGPAAADVMSEWLDNVAQLSFMQGMPAKIADVDCYVLRCGYSGEDGFEIAAAKSEVDKIARVLLSQNQSKAQVIPAGLAARDSLRLEAGFCLYGQELSEDISLVEAGLTWVIAPVRRAGGARAGGFVGAETILSQTPETTPKRRVGCLLPGRMQARSGAQIFGEDGDLVGAVSSGAFSPTLGISVAMAYVDKEYAHSESKVYVNIRDKHHSLLLGGLPMVEHRYYRV